MSLSKAADRFADGAAVLVGDERDETIFVAAAADRVTPDRLEQLQELGHGMVVLGVTDELVRRLELREPAPDDRRRLALRLTTPVDAAVGISGGWSLRDRALTMRVAADPLTRPGDLTMPGHVHAAPIHDLGIGAATAAIELAHLAGRVPAVALCAVVDRDGRAVSLRDARAVHPLAGLPLAASTELRSHAIGRRATQASISCALPTRDAEFRAVGHDGDPATIALVHGDLTSAVAPLVHVHVACLFGDAFGSLLCDCRRQLDTAVAAIAAEGAGAIIYAKPQDSAPVLCTREERIDSALAAGLLRAAGIQSLRLSRRAGWLGGELRACGLTVIEPPTPPPV